MSFCVNIKSKQFKDTAARLGISEGQLELIAHKYGNSEGTYGQFPSDNYIMRQVVGRPELNADENIVRIWHERYQNAQTFTTAEELNAAKTEALRFFEESSIGTTTLPDGRLQMVVAEPNSTEEPLISYMSNNAEQVIDGKLGVNKEQLISLLGSTMYKGNVQSVAVKELLQNAFDAVKIAQSQGKIQGKAKIRVNLDAAERTVTISDNGTGMSPEIVQKAFFTIGGSYKGENVDNRLKSGGLGLAKMAFLFSSEYVEVSTVKDGIKTYVNTNPEQIQNDNFKITTSRTNEPNGTTVTVKIPESYLDENGEKRSIWFDTSPNFLSKPMLGNVEVEVTKKPIWGTETTTTYDKNVIPEGYTPIGKATSDFGDIEMYVAPADSGDITAEVLISGLHQFTKWFPVKGATKGRFKVILNILPTVGVKSAVYPINNQREGFRATIDPEVKDIQYLLNQINRSLEKKSIAATFGSAMSMDVGKIAEVKREASNTDTLNSAVKEVLGQLATKQKTILGIPVGKTQENSLDLKSIRTQRETAEKSRNSSLNTSGINYDRNSSVSSVDTSGLDITKPLFHNNTTMVIGEDGQAVLNELGKLMMELKSLYVQTYKDAGIQSRFGDVIDHISKQFWGISFDKGYGGVNVNPSIINLLAINPFYQVQTYPGVDTALALTEYLTHLIIHEFNHNYAGGEGAGFTGRFPATYAEFAGIGKQFNKEWKNKLYTLIRDNLDTFIKYNKEYEKATNLGESFESDRITAREESTSRSTENDGKDLFWNRSGENVYENGEGDNVESYQKEIDSIKEKAIADGTFMKAPNGNPTNLNEQQWLQVRTKAFKKWFGDWESVAKQKFGVLGAYNKTRASYEGVEVTGQEFDPDMAPDGGTRIIWLGNEQIGEIPTVETSDIIRMSGSIGAATEIFGPLRGKGYGKKAHIALALIAANDGKTLYSDSSNSDAEDALWKSLVRDGLAEVVEERPKTGNWNHTTYRIINSALPQGEVHGYSENVSKVVDKNGEPLVVYHGNTDTNIRKFEPNKGKYSNEPLYYFSDDTKTAQSYATEGVSEYDPNDYTIVGFNVEPNTEEAKYADFTSIEEFEKFINSEGRIYEFFLNLRNPLTEVSPTYIHGDSLIKNTDYDGMISVPFSDVIRGNDSRRNRATQYVATNSNQIKSATGNRGTFSTRDNNIYFNRQVVPLAQRLDDANIIHKLNGKYYLSIKGEENGVQRRKQELQEFLDNNGYKDVVVDYISTGRAVEVTFNTLSEYNDLIAREADRSMSSIKNVMSFLEEKVPAIKGHIHYNTTVEEAGKLLGRALLPEETSFVRGNQIYLIKGRATREGSVEEVLHIITNTLLLDNRALASSLLREAKQLFPQLVRDINRSYKEYSATDRNLEILTQALSRVFRQEYDATKPSERVKVESFLKKFIDWIRNLFGFRENPQTGNKIIELDKLPKVMSLKDFATLINSADGEFSTGERDIVQFNRSETTNTLEVSTAGDAFGKQFSAFNAKFKQGTIINGVDVFGRSIEDVYQNVIKQSGKNMPPATFSRLQTLYRGYATKTEAKAKDLDETVGNTAADYVEGIVGFVPKYHFTSLREEAEGYASTRTDKSEEEFIRDGKVVRQQNRHYTGDFAHVGSYYISKDAKVVTFEDLHDLNRNPQKAENADIIILKRGTLDQSASEFIVREGGKHLIKELSEVSKDAQEEYSYQEGYLPLWQEWARQNPELIEQLRERAEGKTLTDKFARGAVSQARALTEILAQRQEGQQREQAEPSLHKAFQQRLTPIGYKRTGEKINSIDSGRNICTSTQMLCVEMIADAFNNGDLAHHVKVWPVSIWAKSPLEDSIIDHSTTLVKVNGKYYIFDMPQSEYITKTGNTFTQYGKTFNEGLIGEFSPRLIPVEKEIIQQAYQIDEAHIQDTMSSLLSIMKDLDIRNDFEITITETIPPARSEEVNTNTEQAEEPKVEQVFHEKSNTLTGQINTLIDSGIPVTEVREEANKLMDWISDQLTQYLEDPSIVWDKYFADTQDSSQREVMIDRISKMSRQELLELIGVDRILEIYSNEVLSRTEENADMFDSFDDEVSDKFDLIKENLKGLVQLGYSRFSGREGFSITLSEGDESTFDVTETQNTLEQDNPIDTNGENDPDRNFEEEGNQQEHWQIESRTREILDNASAQIKQALSDCLVLVDNGKRKEDGTPDYDVQTDDLGRNERITQLNATRSIVKWTQGALSLQGMIDMLSSKEKENPWISQIITRLKDTSGNESDFQNEFFTVFSKHFQPYSIVIRDADGTFHTSQVNAHPALDDAMSAVRVQYRLGKLPLFNSNGVDTRNLEGLREVNNKLNALGQLSENNRKEAVTLVGEILTTVGFPQSEDSINRVLTDEIKNTLLTAVSNMAIKLDNAAKEKNYDPFKFKDNPNGITGYVQSILRPFTEALEDVMVSSIFDSGKMYQSYITPSWTTKLFKKMHLDNKNFHKFLLNEFATSEWFIDGDANLLAEVPSDRLAKMSDAEKEDAKAEYIGNHPEIWRTPWLRELVQMDEKARMETFVHRVQLNFNKSNYMRGMTDLEYALSVFTEFYADGSKNYKGKKFAYYRLPMLSNKPSNEFIRFTRYSGATALAEITDGFLSIFNQEMSRIQTVRMLELNKADKGYIEYFNERGKQFQFLDYLNDYLVGEKKNTVLGELLNNKLDGKTIDESALTPLVEKAIREHLVEKGDALVSQYKNNGLFEALKNVENVGTSDAAVETAIREFAWNDMFAQANILELLITDKAYYKNEEDLQKRLAQVHSPGTRGNWDAIDYDGNRVSDGKLRIVKISDFAGKDVMINTLANLEEVFDKKIEEAEDSLKDQWRALKESIIAAYKKVNVVDGQAFVSPTAYRKKAIAFGEWSREAENTYNELMQGKFNLASLKSVFNPRKPFTYGKVNKNISEMTGIDTPIKTLNYGVQYKDSEYLLIMADALLRGQETSRPNLLGALFDVMEESAKTNPVAGIDFIVFESGVKTGISGAISISDLVDNPDGRDIAFNRIWRRIINTDGSYNQAYVDTLNAEDYANQQTVPEHFMGHGGLQWGSQVRVIMPSDLEVSYLGQPVEYEFYDDAAREWKKLNKDGIRKEWDNTTAEIINDGINTLKDEFGLNNSEYSQADRNIILSKILQREILSNARYGVDLLLACSVDEQGNFRIPLGDPIQSKRVEQLINSIIKNRINKIKVEGGTLVEVTNFGVSKRLERRYKDKNGNLLKAKRDYLAEGHSEAEFNQYVKENQAGIAYDECYAPAWAREIFENFADRNGNIDVEAIEMLDADLLKMFGYRIPTEDKYSCAPYKIVGFLPKEAGDGFMQPWETTVTDGSDFDVDKKNLMRMVINIKKKIMSKSEFAKANKITNEEELDNKYSKYRKDNNPSPANILKKIGDAGRIKLSATEKAELDAEEERIRKRKTDKAKSLKDKNDNSAVESYNRKYAERVEPLEEKYNTLSEKEDLTEKEERDMLKLDRKIEREVAKLDRELEGKKAENETEYNKRIEEIESELSEIRKDNEARLLNDRKLSIIRKILDEGVFRDSSTVPTNERGVFLAVKRAYIDMMFEASKPTLGKDYLNNKIFNMQWAIATHASTADKMLNPGNFDPQKSMGYKVAAYRLGKHTWEELNAMSIDALKDIVFTSKNLMEFDVQTQFYKQNSVAGQILGIFAVAKSAHAMFEGRNYGILVEDNFTIAGMDFGGIMSLDKMKDRSGVTLIGKTLGSLVSASADAVKDPVLNFMNINKETVNVLNAALRLGMDFDSISLLLSTKTISDILNTYYRSNLSKKVSLKNVIAQKIRELEADPTIGKNSPLAKQELTTKEMIDAIRKDNPNIQYKILKAFQRLSNIADTINPLTNISRLNSVASAVGPQHIDSIMSKNKLDASFKNIVKIGQNGLYEEIIRDDVFQDIPSLRAFYEAYNIVFGDSDNAGLFKQLGITTASEQFNEVLNAIPGDMKFLLMNNKKLLSSLGDFFQSYLLVQSDVASVSQKERYIKNFAKWFTEQGFKSKYPNNPFIQAIQTDVVSKEGQEDKYYLKIETTGMEQSEKDALSAGWIQLEKENPDLSHWLFFYNFWRGGIGFSPKTFMGLVPLQVKEKIGGYLNTYRNLPAINGSTVFDQWVRNNWNNDSLVPRVSKIPISKDGKMLAKGRNYYKVAGSPYVKMNIDGKDVLFRRTSNFSTEYQFAEYEQITPLGNNGEYFEAFPFEDTVKPSAVPNTVDRGTLVSDQLETTEDNPNDVVRTQEEMEQDLVDFIDVLRGDEGRTTELGEAEMEEKFDELTKDLGLSEDKAKFDDIMDNFCR